MKCQGKERKEKAPFEYNITQMMVLYQRETRKRKAQRNKKQWYIIPRRMGFSHERIVYVSGGDGLKHPVPGKFSFPTSTTHQHPVSELYMVDYVVRSLQPHFPPSLGCFLKLASVVYVEAKRRRSQQQRKRAIMSTRLLLLPHPEHGSRAANF